MREETFPFKRTIRPLYDLKRIRNTFQLWPKLRLSKEYPLSFPLAALKVETLLAVRIPSYSGKVFDSWPSFSQLERTFFWSKWYIRIVQLKTKIKVKQAQSQVLVSFGIKKSFCVINDNRKCE